MKKIINCLCCIFMLLIFVACVSSCSKRLTLEEKIKKGETINVDIVKFISAPPLDEAERGIISELEKEGFVNGKNIKLTKHDCQGESSNVGLTVKSVVEKSDLIFAIATPVAVAVYQEQKNRGLSIPTFFTAITDPVSSGIVNSNENPGEFITGASDLNPVADQIAVIKRAKPTATKVGFIYSTDENNSVIQLNLAREKCNELGLELVAQACSNTTEFASASQALVNQKIDALYLPTDSKLSSSSKSVIDLMNQNKIITVGGEESFLDNGATLTYGSVNYTERGVAAGAMAVLVLQGVKKVGNISVNYSYTDDLVINKTVADTYGIELPKEFIDSATKLR